MRVLRVLLGVATFLFCFYLLMQLAPLARGQDVTTTIKFRFFKDQQRSVTKAGNVYTFRCDGEGLETEIMEPAGVADLGVDEFSLTNPEKTFTLTIAKNRTYLAEITNSTGVKQQCLKGDLKTVTAAVLGPQRVQYHRFPVFTPSDDGCNTCTFDERTGLGSCTAMWCGPTVNNPTVRLIP